MTDSRFEKLVNLYLDKEITPEELSDLKAEIAHNLVRRNKFERLCRVHSASRKALIDHSAQSGIAEFLREQVNTVETRKGKRSRVRKAGTQNEVQKRAQEALWQGAMAFMIIIILAGFLTAYLIDRTASSLQERQAKEQNEDERKLDFTSLQEGLAQLQHAEQFILASLGPPQGRTNTHVYVLRWESNSTPSMTAFSSEQAGQWAWFELTRSLSPTEAYEIEVGLRKCAGQLPGTSAPAAIPPPSTPVLLTGSGEYPLVEQR